MENKGEDVFKKIELEEKSTYKGYIYQLIQVAIYNLESGHSLRLRPSEGSSSGRAQT